MTRPIDVKVNEVGLRDGIQSIKTFFATDAKKAWIRAEAAAGVPEIEVCSFVPPKISGQFVDCEVTVPVALEQPGLLVSGLAPNLKGAERALALGIQKINFVLSVSQSHNLANVRMLPAESVENFRRIAELRNSRPEWRDVILLAGLSTALGCTIEGPVDPKAGVALAEQLVAAGADAISIADTVGYANPTQVRAMFRMMRQALGDDVPLNGHFHDTRGLGLANVLAALDEGCRSFDASLAGLGGCMFAPGATGNIVMDDLVFMLESMGLKTGVDVEALLPIRQIIAGALPGEPLHGAIAKAGPPKGYAPASAAMLAAE